MIFAYFIKKDVINIKKFKLMIYVSREKHCVINDVHEFLELITMKSFVLPSQ